MLWPSRPLLSIASPARSGLMQRNVVPPEFRFARLRYEYRRSRRPMLQAHTDSRNYTRSRASARAIVVFCSPARRVNFLHRRAHLRPPRVPPSLRVNHRSLLLFTLGAYIPATGVYVTVGASRGPPAIAPIPPMRLCFIVYKRGCFIQPRVSK
jgi:hypothetical protein